MRHSSQQFRSLVASIEILAAAAVSNALVLGSFVRDRGTKKQRFRFGSTGGHSSLERSHTAPHRAITAKNWGSDADLVGDLGMKLDLELEEKSFTAPLPAPKASPARPRTTVPTHVAVDKSSTSPSHENAETDQSAPGPSREPQPSPSEVPTTPRGMSFFDVGGLLGDNGSPRMHSRHQSIAVPYHSSQTSLGILPNHHAASIAAPTTETRRGSHALLQDIGGLLSPSPRVTTPSVAEDGPEPSNRQSGLIEALQSTPPNSSSGPSAPSRRRKDLPGLQDVGGLLA